MTVKTMRPELQALFKAAVSAWVSYIMFTSLIAQIRISLAILALRSRGLGSSEAEVATGLRFIRDYDNTAAC
jgi:hypothetical protein